MGEYRCVAASLVGFIQQLAVSYVANGYWFYVTGRIPEGKDPVAVDRKLIERYGVAVSKWSRARRKQLGQANVQYLRHERFFVLLATRGEHRFFAEEQAQLRDARRVPIKHGGYAVSFRGGHAHVRIERGMYNIIKAHLLELGMHRRAESVEDAFGRLPFEPYAPVKRQLLNILRAVNRARRVAGFAKIDGRCLRLHRQVVRPFVASEEQQGPRNNPHESEQSSSDHPPTPERDASLFGTSPAEGESTCTVSRAFQRP